MMIDGEIEDRLADIEAISDLFATYVDYRPEDMNSGSLIFLSENLRAKIDEIYTILRN
jgi:hypothetical protein